MDFEGIMLSEISETEKTNREKDKSHLYVESLKKKKLIEKKIKFVLLEANEGCGRTG